MTRIFPWLVLPLLGACANDPMVPPPTATAASPQPYTLADLHIPPTTTERVPREQPAPPGRHGRRPAAGSGRPTRPPSICRH